MKKLFNGYIFFQTAHSKRHGTPWTGRQSIAGAKQRGKLPPTGISDKLTYMHVFGWWENTGREATHTRERTCKLHTERPLFISLTSWGSNRLSCFEAPIQTPTPLYSPSSSILFYNVATELNKHTCFSISVFFCHVLFRKWYLLIFFIFHFSFILPDFLTTLHLFRSPAIQVYINYATTISWSIDGIC